MSVIIHVKYNSGGGTICGRGGPFVAGGGGGGTICGRGGPSVAALHGSAGPLAAGDHLRHYSSL